LIKVQDDAEAVGEDSPSPKKKKRQLIKASLKKAAAEEASLAEDDDEDKDASNTEEATGGKEEDMVDNKSTRKRMPSMSSPRSICTGLRWSGAWLGRYEGARNCIVYLQPISSDIGVRNACMASVSVLVGMASKWNTRYSMMPSYREINVGCRGCLRSIFSTSRERPPIKTN
jgi:hypothetical protein